MNNKKKKLLIIELNEFCPEYIKQLAQHYKLQNLIKVLNFTHTITLSNDKKEFYGLDPWVQWVNIHTGLRSEEHGVKILGENLKKNHTQIWNHLHHQYQLRWAVIGPLNAKKGSSLGCVSFLPDPWSSNEKAYPNELNELLEVIRYVSKNYLALNYFALSSKIIKALGFFLRRNNLFILKELFWELFKVIYKPGINIHTLTTLLDYVCVLYYLKIKSKNNIDISIVFLNHIAHLQHHFWEKYPIIHPQMEHGIKICDKIINLLLKDLNLNETNLLVLNGFKQKRNDENDIQIYRQVSTKLMLNKLGITKVMIEQNMTNDVLLEFSSLQETNNAYKILLNCYLDTGHKLFDVSKINSQKIFIQLNIHHVVNKNVFIKYRHIKIPFYDLFINLGRTGSHINEGDIFSPNIEFPNKIFNHEIFENLVKIYG